MGAPPSPQQNPMASELALKRPRPRGRPSLYDPAYCDRALELAAEGCGKAEIAAALGVSAKTLTAWAKAHEDFKEAMARAKDIEYAWWLSAGRKGQFMRNWSASGWALQMRNRFGKRFRDKGAGAIESEQRAELDAEALREEIERKLSCIAAAGAAGGVPAGAVAEGTGEPQV